MIHIIGDSHSLMFQNIEGCIIHHVGPITMHRIGRDGINIKNYGVRENDFVVFTFGEIDVRCHIGIQRDKQNRAVEEIIETLAQNILLSILQNNRQFTNIHFLICSVVPPTNAHYNPQFPFYGTLVDRIMLTKKLNRNLKSKCESRNVGFLDIYDFYSLENGELNPAMSDGIIHIHSSSNDKIKQCLLDYTNNLQFKSTPSIDAEHCIGIREGIRRARFNDTVRVHFQCRAADGSLLGASANGNPLEFTIGKYQTIPGFESNVVGMHPDESKMFKILPDKAFGLYREELVFEIPGKDIPSGVKPEVGQQFQIDQGNGLRIFTIIKVSETSLTLDANHPFAGKDLFFEVRLVSIAS